MSDCELFYKFDREIAMEARRYRWLREQAENYLYIETSSMVYASGRDLDLDAAIDQAMEKAD